MASIRTNRAYNDPAIGQAFANIAGMFGPPDASDIHAYAAAGLANAKTASEKADAQRLAEMYRIATDPTTSRELIDRYGIGAGRYNPTQSFYSVDQGNLTTRRGQDIKAGTDRYGYDLTAKTDLAKNEADVAARIAIGRGNNAASAIGSLYGPLSQGQVRPDVPAEVAGVVGLPAIAAAQGAPKPLTESEMQAAILQGLPGNEQRAVALKGAGTQNVVGPNGPVVAFDADAVGQQPYIKPDASTVQKVTNGMAVNEKTGEKLNVSQAPGDATWKLPNGHPLPDGFVVMNMPTPTGSNDQLGIKTTEAQDRNALAAALLEEPTNQILGAFDTGNLPTANDYRVFSSLGVVPQVLTPELTKMISPQGQNFYQNLRVALPYQLMAKSGLATTEQEYARTLASLMPVPGEDPGVLASKKHQFATFRTVIRGLAGAALPKAEGGAPAPVGAVPPAIPGTPTRKTIGNKTYERDGSGNWFEVQ